MGHASTIGKNLLNSNISFTCTHNMTNFGPLTAEIGLPVYCSNVAHRRPTKLCTMFDRLLGWCAIYTFRGLLLPNILPGAKFTLRPSLAFSYIGNVTALHSSSGRQTNSAPFSRRRHLYSAGRPSRWASAHILVLFIFCKCFLIMA